jgi:hypothetical protein
LLVERGEGTVIGEVCYDYLFDVILKYGLNGACAFMIAVINKIETDLLKKMVLF